MNGIGRIVVTNLDNLFMPIIRYENGDVGELAVESCQCGRVSPLLKRIIGRTLDVIRTRSGVYVYGDYFTHLLNELGWYNKYKIEKYQFIQEDLNKFCWYLIANPLPDAQDVNDITQIVQAKLESPNVEIKFVKEIAAEHSGKFRYIKSMISNLP